MTTSIEELRTLQAQAAHERTTRSERDVEMVRLRYVDGLTLQVIATRYGLTRQRVMQIVNTPL